MARRPSKSERDRRHTQVIQENAPSIVRSIAEAVVLKEGNLFFLSEPSGSIPCKDGHGFGLYYHDCRYLNGYELRVAGVVPGILGAATTQGFKAMLKLSNPELRLKQRSLPLEQLGIDWTRVLDGSDLRLHDSLEFRNYSEEPIELPVSLTFQAAFEDVYAVRGLIPEVRGQLLDPVWSEGSLRFEYAGADGLFRSLSLHFDPPPHSFKERTGRWRLRMGPEESCRLGVTLVLAESRRRSQVERPPSPAIAVTELETRLQRSAAQWNCQHADIRSDSLLLDRIMGRSLQDLYVLKSHHGSEEYFAAGIPWFGALFGRDSLVASLQALAYNFHIAEQSLRLLAAHQGRGVDDWRDEEPGKILHELRVGELAHCREIPHTPYYGTVEATPLFLVLLGWHARWSGDLALFHELRENVEAALSWIDRYGDLLGNGYLCYRRRSPEGLRNQGWKDSGDGIVNAEGSLARPPIALVEVQGYVYQAKLLMAELFERSGASERAERLRHEARALRARFDRDFWLEDLGFFALALQEEGRPAAVVSSNPGQALWTGIVAPERAKSVIDRLMAEDMFSGWGVRTLSQRERRYNPLGYHLGTIWPHDNSLIAAGCRRYARDDAAYRIFHGLFEAASHFDLHRLPELFSGDAQVGFQKPIPYPVACHPQAWSSGALPHLLQTLLGLEPDGFNRRLRIVRPILPHFVESLDFKHLQVGDTVLDLRFERHKGAVRVKVIEQDGPLEVRVEDQSGRVREVPHASP